MPDTPFVSALADIRRIVRARAASHERTADEAGDATATVAEQFQLNDNVHMFRLRGAGTALRLLDAELAIGHHTASIRWADASETYAPGTPVPPASLAAVQLGAILTAADGLSPR